MTGQKTASQINIHYFNNPNSKKLQDTFKIKVPSQYNKKNNKKIYVK